MTPRTTVIVVTYQSSRTIGQTLRALRQARASAAIEVVVVDNHSTDGTRSILQTHADWADIVLHERNVGFGRGCNLGAEHAETEFLLFLNPDAAVTAEAIRTLERLLDENPRAGIVAPAIFEEERGLQTAGGIPSPVCVITGRAPAGRRVIEPGGDAFETNWVCGAVFMIRRTLWEQLGGFDPRFFLYFEETDLCLRAHKAGVAIMAVGEAVATHVGGASASATDGTIFDDQIVEHYFRSRFYFLVKHYGWFAASTAELSELVRLSGSSLIGRLRGRKKGSIAARLRAPILSLPKRA